MSEDSTDRPNDYGTAIGIWRGRVDKTLDVLEKAVSKQGENLTTLTTVTIPDMKSSITRLVVITGGIVSLLTIISSIAIGLILKSFH